MIPQTAVKRGANLAGLGVGEDELAERAKVLHCLVGVGLEVVFTDWSIDVDLSLVLKC